MKNYVLVADEHKILCPRPYMGNVMLIQHSGEPYRHYLVESGYNSYEIFNTDPDDRSTNHKVRCPRCSAQLVRTMSNQYHCIICKGWK